MHLSSLRAIVLITYIDALYLNKIKHRKYKWIAYRTYLFSKKKCYGNVFDAIGMKYYYHREYRAFMLQSMDSGYLLADLNLLLFPKDRAQSIVIGSS